jgi:hypothetical protein
MSVSTEPGARALILMCRGAKSAAIARVPSRRAALAIEYIDVFAANRKAPAEMTFSTAAWALSSRWGSASWIRNTGPRRLTSIDLVQASGV